MTTAEKYVTAAYLVVLGVVLLYVVIYSAKVARLKREVAQLTAQRRATDDGTDEREQQQKQALVT